MFNLNGKTPWCLYAAHAPSIKLKESYLVSPACWEDELAQREGALHLHSFEVRVCYFHGDHFRQSQRCLVLGSQLQLAVRNAIRACSNPCSAEGANPTSTKGESTAKQEAGKQAVHNSCEDLLERPLWYVIIEYCAKAQYDTN